MHAKIPFVFPVPPPALPPSFAIAAGAALGAEIEGDEPEEIYEDTLAGANESVSHTQNLYTTAECV